MFITKTSWRDQVIDIAINVFSRSGRDVFDAPSSQSDKLLAEINKFRTATGSTTLAFKTLKNMNNEYLEEWKERFKEVERMKNKELGMKNEKL